MSADFNPLIQAGAAWLRNDILHSWIDPIFVTFVCLVVIAGFLSIAWRLGGGR